MTIALRWSVAVLQVADPHSIVSQSANPVTADHSELRRSLLPGLVQALVENERQRRTDLAVFEVGALHQWDGSQPVETATLGLAAVGDAMPASWQEAARPVEIDDLKGLIAWLVERIAGTAVRFEPGDTKSVRLVPIAGARVIRGGNGWTSGPVTPGRTVEVPS